MTNIILEKVKVGKTVCDKYCTYWSGQPSEHNCGKPIYDIRYKCGLCERLFISEPACKTHHSIKHKKEL